MPTVNERQAEFDDVLAQPRLDPSRDGHDHEPERHTRNTHSYANPLPSVGPTPPPARRNSARRPSSPVAIPSVGVHTTKGNDDGDEAVGTEDTSLSRHGLSTGTRNPSQENVIGTEYSRHTDAGMVRVVELPSSYDDLRLQPAHQE